MKHLSLALCSTFPAYRHVGFAASVHGFSHGVNQVAADAKVTHLHLALSVDQHVGGLHIYDTKDKVFCAATGADAGLSPKAAVAATRLALRSVVQTDCVTLF